jgi:hypothetical protein
MGRITKATLFLGLHASSLVHKPLFIPRMLLVSLGTFFWTELRCSQYCSPFFPLRSVTLLHHLITNADLPGQCLSMAFAMFSITSIGLLMHSLLHYWPNSLIFVVNCEYFYTGRAYNVDIGSQCSCWLSGLCKPYRTSAPSPPPPPQRQNDLAESTKIESNQSSGLSVL